MGLNKRDDEYPYKCCPICGVPYDGTRHACDKKRLAATDGALEKEDTLDFMIIRSETERLVEGLEILEWGDDEPIDDDELEKHGIFTNNYDERDRRRRS